jgi:hypothetical protein
VEALNPFLTVAELLWCFTKSFIEPRVVWALVLMKN